jgi:hypothetical protein
MINGNKISEIDIPLVDGWGEKIVPQFSPSTAENFYIDINNSKEPALINTPGLSNPITIPFQNNIRQLFTNQLTDDIHVVAGSSIYRIGESLQAVFGIALDTADGFASIEGNIDQIMFVDGKNGYLLNKTTNVYTQVTSINFPVKPRMVSVLAGRFFVNAGDTDQMNISEINDGNNWTGNIIRLTSYPEKIIAHGTIKGRLFILGTRCGEVWFASGVYPFVQRDENLLLEYGCAAIGSFASGEDRLCWLGYDKQGITSVVATDGGLPVKISTDEIEAEFQKYDVVDDARAFIYKNSGNIFYQITFPRVDKSFLYNFNTNTWTMLTSLENHRHLAECHAFFNKYHYFGVYNAGKIYRVDNEYYADDTTVIKRKFTTRVLYPMNGRKFILHKIRVHMQQGYGTPSGVDARPKLLMKVSRDNGMNFGGSIYGDVGVLGARETYTDFHRLGHFEWGSMVLDFEHYNKTPCNIFKITAYVS